jgi:hypothetical protein
VKNNKKLSLKGTYFFRILKINKKMESTLNYAYRGVEYINSKISKEIDDELMGDVIKYSVDQLMEIAGLSCSKCIQKAIETEDEWKGIRKILNISGPGSK